MKPLPDNTGAGAHGSEAHRRGACAGGSGSPKPSSGSTRLDLGSVRKKLSGVRGQDYWRSLEEVAETPEFTAMMHREFPPGATEWMDGVSRRSFLKMAAATMALAGLTACTKQPVREIFPYVKEPGELVPGEPLYYATSMLLGGFATGVLAKSREGHPIKVDGNPNHPAGPGGSSIWLQASILDLYDPDRSQAVTHRGELSTWARFLSELNDLNAELKVNRGSGLRLLTETVTSPTLANQLDELLHAFPEARWVQYDPISRDYVREGARMAFGQMVETHYRFDKAAVILSLESDFLYSHPQRLRYTREFIDGRRVSTGKREMSRLYLVESTPTVTGTMADHRLPLESTRVPALAREIARRLDAPLQSSEVPLSDAQARWVDALAKDLRQHRGSGIVIAGEWQPPSVHALAHLLNEFLGNTGNTVFHSDTAEAQPELQMPALQTLVEEMKAGSVDTLFILGGNPVYSAPADLGFEQHLQKVRRSIHLGMDQNETAVRSTWHIPQNHYLESWGDARSFDGTVSLLQPLISPLYDTKSACELMGALSQQQPIRSDYDLVRAFWQKQELWPDFEKGWRQALHDGFIPGTQSPPCAMRVKSGLNPFSEADSPPRDGGAWPQRDGLGVLGSAASRPAVLGSGLAESPFGSSRTPTRLEDVEVCFRPDPNLWDGSFANNGWLQECPRPVSKLTWDNAVLLSPSLADRAGLRSGDLVEVHFQGRTVEGPLWLMPGQAERTVTLHLGYGRQRVGRVGEGIGFNACALRISATPWAGSGGALVTTGRHHVMVATQTHHNLESPERQVYRAATLEALRIDPDVIRKTVQIPPDDQTLYDTKEYQYKGYKWGMSIDLTACIGCNACLLACEVENNIPVVGKDQVRKNREMFWIRVDTYYQGTLDNPSFKHAPIPCMHCEHAPCELVCPVEAAVHDSEGLNLQVYQRCVGTRFCSNNCPYKVRRFNFLRYTDYHTPNFKPMYNPEVTVRWRGVMEKCTYCVQRISAARITAEKGNRPLRDGEVLPACQEACPAEAIVFGDLNTPESKVARLKRQELDYPMLGELNVRPRTTYLARIDNPNPQLKPVDADSDSEER